MTDQELIEKYGVAFANEVAKAERAGVPREVAIRKLALLPRARMHQAALSHARAEEEWRLAVAPEMEARRRAMFAPAEAAVGYDLT